MIYGFIFLSAVSSVGFFSVKYKGIFGVEYPHYLRQRPPKDLLDILDEILSCVRVSFRTQFFVSAPKVKFAVTDPTDQVTNDRLTPLCFSFPPRPYPQPQCSGGAARDGSKFNKVQPLPPIRGSAGGPR